MVASIRGSIRIPALSNRGFTLIELLLVIAIVSLLVTLALPRFFGQVDLSKEVVLKENLRVLRLTLDQFYGDLGRYPDALSELVEKGYLRDLPVDPIAESNSSWVITPVPLGYSGNIYGISSSSPKLGKNGVPYSAW